MRTFRGGVRCNGVGAAKKRFEGFVDLDHIQCCPKQMLGIVGEVEGQIRRDSKFERAEIDGGIGPPLQVGHHAGNVVIVQQPLACAHFVFLGEPPWPGFTVEGLNPVQSSGTRSSATFLLSSPINMT
ncbi:hypothetical protein D3C87_1730420 [compost metagenome]